MEEVLSEGARIKTGLVIEGGGMKCAYSAGILDKFLDDGIHFDYVVGVSAGAANAASYMAGQRDRNRRFYTEHIHKDGYFGLTSMRKWGELFGLNTIYGTMTNEGGDDPLDYDAVMENPAAYEVVATNALTGEPTYFAKEKMIRNKYTHIKASCALPAACRPRFINGIPYYDGGVSDPIPVDHALDGHCDRAVLILSKPRDFVKTPEKLRRVYTERCHQFPEIIKLLNERHISYMRDMHHAYDLEKEGKALIFAPSENLPMSTYAMDGEANQRLYDLGVHDYEVQRERLQAFMQGSIS